MTDTEEFDRPMTALELAIYIADEFHDWIDGDDWPEACKLFQVEEYAPEVIVTFASGKRFSIAVQELESAKKS